jgi:flagellar protein FliT
MMMTSQETLSVYEAMVELTGQMLAATQGGDWDQLDALEESHGALVRRLNLQAAPPLTGASRLKKVEIIGKMLADDRKIRELTMPWMAQLSSLMHRGGAQRELASATNPCANRVGT